MEISTIGYEGASLADFIYTLRSSGVKKVLDIRELPQSRRPGFSKKSLSLALSDAGIAYEHFKALGDPKEGRDAARSGRHDDFVKIFSDHLSRAESQEALARVAEVAKVDASVLLCFERNPKYCHRSLVGQELTRLHSFAIKHLGVQAKPSGGVGVAGTERYASACG